MKGGEDFFNAGLLALGRAGVLDLQEDLVTLVDSQKDLTALMDLYHVSRGQIESVERYAKGRRCRRRHILQYFGEEPHQDKCHRCDRCLNRRRPLWEGLRRGAALFGLGESQ